MLAGINEEFFVQPLLLSLKISLLASIISLCVGTLAVHLLAYRRFYGKTLLETFFMLPMVLPPTVVGFLLLILLGRKSFIGRLVEGIFGQSIIFSWYAAVVAAIVVSFPLVYQTVKSGLAVVSAQCKEAARIDGANEWQVLLHIVFPLSIRSLLAAYILGFARALGEFGATYMVAGNIPGRTQTIPTAIYTAVDTNQMHIAWLWTIIIALISFILLLLTRFPEK